MTVSSPTSGPLAPAIGMMRIGLLTVWASRSDVFVGLTGLVLRVYLLTLLWASVFGEATSQSGRSLTVTTTYVALSATHLFVFGPLQHTPLPQRIADGRVVGDFLRPIGVMTQAVYTQAGASAAFIVPGAVAFTVFSAAGLAAPSDGPMRLVAYSVSVILAFVLTQFLNLLAGMLTFWTLETAGPFALYRIFSQLLSGALVPLWLMPDWLHTICRWLPFQAQSFTPAGIYSGAIDGHDVPISLLIQAGWIAGLLGLTSVIWRVAVRRLVVHGG